MGTAGPVSAARNGPEPEENGVDEQEKRETLARYDARLNEFGHDPRTLGWSKLQHQLRYEILLSYWKLSGADLLDFGCGFGDMYGYCQATGRSEVRYHGIDLNPRLIAEGLKRYPDADLVACDAVAKGLPASYDVIVASGLYNFRLKDNLGFIAETFRMFAAGCRQGFSANFITNRTDFKAADHYYADPCTVLDLCYKYSRRVLLRQDYMPFEFTVFVDMRDSFDQNYTVFPEYLGFISTTDPTRT
jgi:ubiquinone/menaquinone biosynthesis C-methylase UbiE